MPILRAIDRLLWDDRYEPMRHLVAYAIVILAAFYFVGHFAAATAQDALAGHLGR